MKIFDPVGALRVLTEHNVRFVVIGGLAASAHGSPSLTNDIDICHDRETSNLQNLAEALTRMHATLRGAPEEVPFLLDAESLRRGMNFTFWTDFGALDCLGEPAGVRGYEELIHNAEEHEVFGYAIKVCSLDDLILMKERAGRPIDRIELEILGALKEERDRES